MEGKFINELERGRIQNEIRADLLALNSAFARLVTIRELQIPRSLSMLDETQVTEIISQRQALVRQDFSMTEDEKDIRLRAWGAIMRKATRNIRVIKEITVKWPHLVFHYDVEADAFYTLDEEVERVAEELATYPIPPEAMEHRQLINEAIASINRLEEFEKRHDCFNLPLSRLSAMSDDELAAAWHDRIILRPKTKYTPARDYNDRKVL